MNDGANDEEDYHSNVSDSDCADNSFSFSADRHLYNTTAAASDTQHTDQTLDLLQAPNDYSHCANSPQPTSIISEPRWALDPSLESSQSPDLPTQPTDQPPVQEVASTSQSPSVHPGGPTELLEDAMRRDLAMNHMGIPVVIPNTGPVGSAVAILPEVDLDQLSRQPSPSSLSNSPHESAPSGSNNGALYSNFLTTDLTLGQTRLHNPRCTNC